MALSHLPTAQLEREFYRSAGFGLGFFCPVDLARIIKPLKRTAVRCEADGCEATALLFVAAGIKGGVWAYRDKHARLRSQPENVELPEEISATPAPFRWNPFSNWPFIHSLGKLPEPESTHGFL